jgi:hypothetical protein
MTRPPLEVADIVRAQGNRFIENNSRWALTLKFQLLSIPFTSERLSFLRVHIPLIASLRQPAPTQPRPARAYPPGVGGDHFAVSIHLPDFAVGGRLALWVRVVKAKATLRNNRPLVFPCGSASCS